MCVQGIDVSHWQGKIDFEKVKKENDIEFVILHAGYGKSALQEDSNFQKNYYNAKKAKLNVGAYWVSYACDKKYVQSEAEAEAQAFMEVIKGKEFEYPVYLDLEQKAQFENGMDFCSDVVKYFCNALEKNRYFAGLYMSCSQLQEYIDPKTAKRYSLWIAEYNAKCSYSKPYGIWQKSNTGKVKGISGDVDLDECHVNFPDIIKRNGLNGFGDVRTDTQNN